MRAVVVALLMFALGVVLGVGGMLVLDESAPAKTSKAAHREKAEAKAIAAENAEHLATLERVQAAGKIHDCAELLRMQQRYGAITSAANTILEDQIVVEIGNWIQVNNCYRSGWQP